MLALTLQAIILYIVTFLSQCNNINNINEEMDPKQKQDPVVDVTDDGSKV